MTFEATIAIQQSQKAVTKPTLNFWQIWNLCFGFIGIQFGFALQNANVSRIFQILGANIEKIPLLWVAAPITGLLVQPVIGYMSDKTWNRFGRRRPYLLLGAITASIALMIMPNSPSLWIAAGMLWVMDASFNVALGPALALVSDMLPNGQRSSGFSMQSFFIGVSAVVASALPWMLSHWGGISNVAPAGVVPHSVVYAFYIGGSVLLLTVIWASISTREYSPELLAQFNSHHVQQEDLTAEKPLLRSGLGFLAAGITATAAVALIQLAQQLFILTFAVAIFGALQLLAEHMRRQGQINNGFYHITQDLLNMPATMRQLAVVQFLSWFALFSMWIYGTSAVTSYHYGTLDTASPLYSEGADWVGVLFAAYNGFAALAAIVIPVFIRLTSPKITHIINLCLGALGLMSFLLIKDPQWLLSSMVAIGFAWASILSLPYAMLASSLPPQKMGVYAGIFNFFIVIPQILAASILALVVQHWFHNHTIYALVCGGFFMLLAAIATWFVDDLGSRENH